MSEITMQEVGAGTEAQIIISMEALGEYNLTNLDWECVFEGASQYVVAKSDAVLLDDGTYECLVDTSTTGTGKGEIKAWLKVYGIPTINNRTRTEVTPPMAINLKVI